MPTHGRASMYWRPEDLDAVGGEPDPTFRWLTGDLPTITTTVHLDPETLAVVYGPDA